MTPHTASTLAYMLQGDARDAAAMLTLARTRATLLPDKRMMLLSGLAGFQRTLTQEDQRMDYIEQDCTIEHEGRKYTSGGALVCDAYLIAYPDKGGVLKDWHGNVIGRYSVISSRPAVFFGRRSWQGSRYCYMRATLTDGRRYALRGFGAGMFARGKRTK